MLQRMGDNFFPEIYMILLHELHKAVKPLTKRSRQFAFQNQQTSVWRRRRCNIERLAAMWTFRFVHTVVVVQGTEDSEDMWDLLLQQSGEAMVPTNHGGGSYCFSLRVWKNRCFALFGWIFIWCSVKHKAFI